MSSRVEVGKYINTFGIKGEIKIYPYVDYFENLEYFYIDEKKYDIERMRFKKNIAIVKLKDIDDINLIEMYKGLIVTIDSEDIPELPEGEYYREDLIGLEVYTDEGRLLGKLDDVFNTGANDIYQVGKILLPATDEVVKQIDIDNNKIIVHIINGLLDI